MLNKPLILDLNRIRDLDRTYVNGVLVGQTASGDARRYTIPANLLVEGENRVTVQVLNFSDKGDCQATRILQGILVFWLDLQTLLRSLIFRVIGNTLFKMMNLLPFPCIRQTTSPSEI